MSAPVAQIAIAEHDPNSFANNRHAKVTHSHLQISVSFADSVLRGHVDHTVEIVAATTSLVLDTAPGLKVSAASVVDGESLAFAFGEADAIFGVPLAVTLPASATVGSKLVVRIAFETSPSAGALQWLPPAQTKGGKHPYLFSQAQAIHARSMLPCQDTPSNKFTYSAVVSVDAPLTALMSARRTGSNAKGSVTEFTFNQPEPIPSYLLAIAVGELDSREIGPRSLVWSEPALVDAGAHEFALTEKFIAAGEAVCGPYPWGTYDVLLMPPSFPYGGMENPQITYVTPTLLAGDRSLANVVAHEIAHSWFGNYVTSETWESFWMNEGFTVFLERKIVKALHGKLHQDLHAQIGLQDLQKSVDMFGADHPHTCLCPRLKGIDPDDAFSSVPYEKGFNFLTYLENLVGGESVMNAYLRAHVERFAHTTVNSSQFKAFFLDYMRTTAKVGEEVLSQIDWDTWYNKPGMPAVENVFDQTLIKAATDLADVLLAGGDAANAVASDATKGWDSAQSVIFLERFIAAQKDLAKDGQAEKRAAFADTLKAVDAKFAFSASQNCELKFRWLTLCVRQGLTESYPAVGAFLTSVGRMVRDTTQTFDRDSAKKYVRPLYRDLFVGGGEGRAFAIKLFVENRSFYHSIAQKMVARDLEL